MLRKRNIFPKINIRKGDIVQLLSGDDRGKRGRVLSVFPRERKAIVEGINLVTRHTKPNQKNPKGGLIKKEALVHVSKLMFVDPKTNEPTRLGRRREEDDKGKAIWVRISKKTDERV